MSNTRHLHFRNFLTERFTAAAVAIFEEVESIVEEYYEENKRLRNLLHMVLSPVIKLPRIDVSQYTGAPTDVREQPPEPNTNVDLEMSEPLPKKPKEEQIEYDISWGSEMQQQQQQQQQQQHHHQGLGETDNLITPDCVKSDPEEEEASNMACISDSHHIQVVKFNPVTSTSTLSAVEANAAHCFSLDSDAVTDFPQVSRSKESTSKSCELQKQTTKSTIKKSNQFLQKTKLQLPRIIPYKSLIDASTDYQSFLARLTEAFSDFPDERKPLITKMGLTEDVELVDCAIGKVPKGCPLSYQCPVPSSLDFKTFDHCVPRPLLPLSYHTLEPMLNFPTLSAKEQEHMTVMQISWEEAHSLEHSTRPPYGSKELVVELQKLRLTSRFREICKLKPGRSNAEHLIFKIQRGRPRCKMAQIEEEMKTEAIREYCRGLCVNWYPCGLVVHPSAPWLGALPDGMVYDPSETPNFGLVHVKCIGTRSFIDCSFLDIRDGVLQLKKTHPFYWHIQGEMMVVGASWCDLLVLSIEDILVQRIYRDNTVIDVMKKKLDDFFFYYYLPSVLN